MTSIMLRGGRLKSSVKIKREFAKRLMSDSGILPCFLDNFHPCVISSFKTSISVPKQKPKGWQKGVKSAEEKAPLVTNHVKATHVDSVRLVTDLLDLSKLNTLKILFKVLSHMRAYMCLVTESKSNIVRLETHIITIALIIPGYF